MPVSEYIVVHVLRNLSHLSKTLACKKRKHSIADRIWSLLLDETGGTHRGARAVPVVWPAALLAVAGLPSGCDVHQRLKFCSVCLICGTANHKVSLIEPAGPRPIRLFPSGLRLRQAARRAQCDAMSAQVLFSRSGSHLSYRHPSCRYQCGFCTVHILFSTSKCSSQPKSVATVRDSIKCVAVAVVCFYSFNSVMQPSRIPSLSSNLRFCTSII